MKKKIVCLFLAILLLLIALAGCQNEVMPVSTKATTTAAELIDFDSTAAETIPATEEATEVPTTETPVTEAPTEPAPVETVPDDAVPVVTAKQEDPAHVHSYMKNVVAPTCDKEGVTTYTCECGASYQTKQAALGHAWGAWNVTKEPTCSDVGSREAVCTRCGAKTSERLSKKEHTWGSWTVTRGATCYQKGEQTHTCSVCGKSETKEIATTAHNMGAWTRTKEPTCSAEGTDTRSCQNAGCTHTETRSVAKTSHTMVEGVKTNPTCTEKGYTTYKCANCSFTEKRDYVNALGHDFKYTKTVEPTTTSTGYDLYTCSRCGATEKRNEKPKLEPGSWANAQTLEEVKRAVNAYIASLGVHVDPNAGRWAGGIGAEAFSSKEECIAYFCRADQLDIEWMDEMYGRDGYALTFYYEWYNGHWVLEIADGKYFP